MTLKKRYDRNMTALSMEDCEILFSKRVCIAGCGGLGGYIIEMFGRLGVGNITAIDGDVFDESNLNRQLLSDETVLGQSKALAAAERMKKVNSDVRVNPVTAFINEDNCTGLLADHDLVVDALDNIPARKLLVKHCAALGIPLIHGAISGWNAQITVIPPGGNAFDILYPDTVPTTGSQMGNPAFTPALAASIEVAEAVKVLCGKGTLLIGKLLYVDMLSNECNIIRIGK